MGNKIVGNQANNVLGGLEALGTAASVFPFPVGTIGGGIAGAADALGSGRGVGGAIAQSLGEAAFSSLPGAGSAVLRAGKGVLNATPKLGTMTIGRNVDFGEAMRGGAAAGRQRIDFSKLKPAEVKQAAKNIGVPDDAPPAVQRWFVERWARRGIGAGLGAARRNPITTLGAIGLGVTGAEATGLLGGDAPAEGQAAANVDVPQTEAALLNPVAQRAFSGDLAQTLATIQALQNNAVAQSPVVGSFSLNDLGGVQPAQLNPDDFQILQRQATPTEQTQAFVNRLAEINRVDPEATPTRAENIASDEGRRAIMNAIAAAPVDGSTGVGLLNSQIAGNAALGALEAQQAEQALAEAARQNQFALQRGQLDVQALPQVRALEEVMGNNLNLGIDTANLNTARELEIMGANQADVNAANRITQQGILQGVLATDAARNQAALEAARTLNERGTRSQTALQGAASQEADQRTRATAQSQAAQRSQTQLQFLATFAQNPEANQLVGLVELNPASGIDPTALQNLMLAMVQQGLSPQQAVEQATQMIQG